MVTRAVYTDQIFKMATKYVAKFFSSGWGSVELLRQLADWKHVVLDQRKMMNDIYKDLEKIPIKVRTEKVDSFYTIYKGEFISPLSILIPKALPAESEMVHFELVLPNNWRSSKKPVCIHLAGTGDHFFWRRRHFMASPLAKQYSIGSIILENPFYGHRKPKNQVRSAVNHVSDIFVMGAALLFETVTLMLWCQRNEFGPLGITGVSMGGHMATVSASGWFEPIAIVPCLSWSSAAPAFTEGVLSHSVNWPVLEKQLAENPEYQKTIRNDTEFLQLLQSHYEYSASNKLNEHKTSNNSEINNQNELMKASLIYSKFSSVLSDMKLSSYLDLKGKKVGQISMELDLWKYLDTLPKQLYNSTYGKINFDYFRELTVSYSSEAKYPSEETLGFMTALMDQHTHLSYFNKPHEQSPIIYVVAEHDRYIPREYYHVTPKDIWPNTEVRTIDTGHVIACLNRQSDFRTAIRDAYSKLGCSFD